MISIFHHVCFHHPPYTPCALHSALARAETRKANGNCVNIKLNWKWA
ncbi:hypothetical protein ABIA41_006331 [Bradyrhizobium sp. USDA 313]